MPGHRDIVGTERAHLIAAYVYQLSHQAPDAGERMSANDR